jgi:hypothetical protein
MIAALQTNGERPMKAVIVLALAAILAGTASPSNAAQWRCTTSYNGNTSSSHCGWVYSQQELYERGQRNAVRELDYNSAGGTRRPSDRACKEAIERGVENDLASSYGCRE